MTSITSATNSVQQATLKLATELMVRGGPRLVRVKPLRRAMVGYFEKQIMNMLKYERAMSELPPGVSDDRAVMGLALLHTIERALCERYVSPAVVRRAIQNLGKSTIIESGDRGPAESFRDQYGTHPPAFLVIAPGKSCNLRCVGCYADSGAAGEKLDWPTFDRIITEAKTLWGARLFVITGGEPFAYRSQGKGVLDVAEKHSDCFFMSYTNGTLINDQIAERLAEIGNFTPAISVEGWRQRTDERRGEGVFDKILVTMDRLRQAGVPYGVSLTATRHNVEEILSDEFFDFFFEEHGVLYGWIFHYMPIGRSYTLDLMPTPKQRLWMWRRSWDIIRERQIFLADFWNHGTVTDGCISSGRSTGGGYMYIDWNGSVTPCVFVPYSPVNVNKIYATGGTLNDAWADAFFAGIRDWQNDYRIGNGRPGNWMAPCVIRDHHADFRRLVMQHEPDPTDQNAAEALLDPDYARGMEAYDEAYGSLSGEIWEKHYLRPTDANDGHIEPLPDVPSPTDTPPEKRAGED
jgi:MoaA/NifB/PqqE/SkfB family radical SAM enzyme